MMSMAHPDRLPRFLAWSVFLILLAALAAVGTVVPWFVALMAALIVEAFLICWVLRTGLLQNLFLSLGVVLIVLAGYDLKARWWGYVDPVQKIHPTKYSARLFGQPRETPESFSAVAIRKATRDLLYAVTYTLDINGHRLTKGGGPGTDTYLFFGDSYTYGEGVADSETLPSQFSAAFGQRFTVANLAFAGYSPNHMLRLLETGAVDAVVTGKVRRAFYPMITDHLDRVVGRYQFSLPGPRYVLDADGQPIFTGRLLDRPEGRLGWLAIKAGGAPGRVRELLMQAVMPERYRLDLTLAILARSAKILREKYGTELVVLVWTFPDRVHLVDEITRLGIRALSVNALIGDVYAPGMRLMKGVDNHPTGEANRRLAAALAGLERAAAGASDESSGQ